MHTQTRVAFLTEGVSETSWSVIKQLEELESVALLVVQTQPIQRFRLRTSFNYISTKIAVFLREALFRENHPQPSRPRLDFRHHISSDFNSDEIHKILISFQPHILMLNETKPISTRILNAAEFRIKLHYGFLPLYRGVSPFDWVTIERNFNYYYATVHQVESEVDAGNIVTARYVRPYYREPLNLFRRRLCLAGAQLLVDSVQSWPAVNSVPQTSGLASRTFRNADKTISHTRSLKTIYYSMDMERYTLMQSKFSWKTGNLQTLVLRTLAGAPSRIIPKAAWAIRQRQLGNIGVFLAKRAIARKALKRVERNHLPNGFYILNYHEICDDNEIAQLDASRMSSIYTSKSHFLSHLEFLGKYFVCVPLHKGIDLWKQGLALKERIVSLTMDDGLSSPLTCLDAMNNYDLSPTLFICGDPILRNRPLMIHKNMIISQYKKVGSRPEGDLDKCFDELIKYGFDESDYFSRFVSNKYLKVEETLAKSHSRAIGYLGSHTWDHSTLENDSVNCQLNKIDQCHNGLKNIFGNNLRYFSFPFGKIDRHSFVSEYIANRMCDMAFHCNGGINVQPNSPGSMLRISIPNIDTASLDRLLRLQWTR